MPRRPRPASRSAPKRSTGATIRPKPDVKTKAPLSYRPVPLSSKRVREEEAHSNDEGDDEEDGNAEFEGLGGDESDDTDNSGDEDEEDVDVDAPRVAQWVDEDELDGEDDEESDSEANEKDPSSDLTRLRNDLSSLPLGALRRAQRVLEQSQAEQSSDSNNFSEEQSEDEDSGPEEQGTSSKKEKVEWSTKPRTDIAKRANKHAPTEVTSKKPVTRRRTVVEVKKTESRDPRFLSVAGSFAPDKFHQQYSFLATSHTTELNTLRTNLTRARKLLSNSPKVLREEREAEVERLERALKRMESLVQRDKREEVEREALSKVKKEEKDRRKEGKGGWWMKESDKKQMLAKARYEALAKGGGKRAVKKAIEKKQKKIGQKEKKSRPYAKDGQPSTKRRRIG